MNFLYFLLIRVPYCHEWLFRLGPLLSFQYTYAATAAERNFGVTFMKVVMLAAGVDAWLEFAPTKHPTKEERVAAFRAIRDIEPIVKQTL